jgi:hypothetical protein
MVYVTVVTNMATVRKTEEVKNGKEHVMYCCLAMKGVRNSSVSDQQSFWSVLSVMFHVNSVPGRHISNSFMSRTEPVLPQYC